MKAHKMSHGNPWMLGVIGLALSALLFALAPSMGILSGALLVFAAFHLAVGALALFSIYLLTPAKIKQTISGRIHTRRETQGFDFGWSQAWMNGYWVVGAICLGLAVILFVQFGSPLLQILSLILLLASINLFVGNFVWRTSRKNDYMTLPFVDLGGAANGVILDAGCGSGRTTVALGRVMPKAKIVALDRFDADYIEAGGRALLERNLRIAGLTDRVQIVPGDLTRLDLESNKFDAAVSTYVMDHVEPGKLEALKEINRVLKTGGRFLMVVFEPNEYTFAVANVMSFFLTSRKQWKELFKQAGFSLLQEGIINGGAFFLVQKPQDSNHVAQSK